MTLKQPVLADDDPRREEHATTYQASKGGWFPAPDKPVPGTPKEETGR